MRVIVLAGAFAVICSAAPKLTFTKSFPGSAPAYVCVDLDRTGALAYKESPTDDQPLRIQLQDSDTAALFSMAEKLDFFKSPLESGLKIANMGKKTLRYQDESGAVTETSFNYSTNVVAQQLLERFEQIAASERAYLELERTMRFDKLGVNEALAQIESLWLRKQLAAPQQFIPLFTRIATHESFMHLVRDRAARLKDEFQAPPSSQRSAQEPK
ncbi:MAG: hypothetical protein JO091_06940 [Acidobacteriaceae bacterium]|nr:hypothetical protein [Acidobacteriaceae bacterium]